MAKRAGKYGDFWVCPELGCDIRGTRYRGRAVFSDQPTRDARIAAHKAFDELWRSLPEEPACGERSDSAEPCRNKRSAAYMWLAEKLGLPLQECHIKQFDRGQCACVIALSQERGATDGQRQNADY